jgi:uncharacterized damage-inducible protein DinB
MDATVLRESLVELLKEGHAHVAAERALADVKAEIRTARPAASVRSIWEELEHMRIAQEDILRYTLDASWVSPEWPAGYWPATAEGVTDEAWDASVSKFFADLEELVGLVRDPGLDLTTKIPHGGGHTHLREVLLVADHNAYHVGQIVQLRKTLGDWPD